MQVIRKARRSYQRSLDTTTNEIPVDESELLVHAEALNAIAATVQEADADTDTLAKDLAGVINTLNATLNIRFLDRLPSQPFDTPSIVRCKVGPRSGPCGVQVADVPESV